MTRGRAVVCWQQQKQVMAVLMMPNLVCLSDGDLLHTKAGSEQTAGAKTGLHSLLLVVKRTRSAVQSTPITAIQNYQKTHRRASTGGRQWRAREVDVLGVLGVMVVVRKTESVSEREKQHNNKPALADYGKSRERPAWTSLGGSRPAP
jgi:hypothetical protein